jgi:iron complex outermembrane receptor protein
VPAFFRNFIYLPAVALSLSLGATPALANPKAFNIDSQDAPRALLEFGRQSEVQILFASDKVKGIITNSVHGSYEPVDALNMLLKGTSLVVSVKPDGVLVVDLAKVHDVASPNATSNSDSLNNQAGKKSSQDFRLAQVDQNAAGPQAVEKNKGEESDSKKKTAGLEEIVVTGTRIPVSAKDGPQDVKVYTSEQIAQSGQSTVADFLNTRPEVSLQSTESGTQTPYGITTVQLHGLPVGTTLVLLDGRRVGASGAGSAFGAAVFDLNSIPVAAVDRIEIAADGSSAVYGSDAIAGVVNIILKKNFQGLALDGSTGWASGLNEQTASLTWGAQGAKWSASVVASFQNRGELDGSKRSITADNDYAPYGGADARQASCSPGNVFSADGVTPLAGLGTATFAAVPAGFHGPPSIQEFAATAGTLNLCSNYAYSSYIPATRREGILASGRVEIMPGVEVFSEVMASHVEELSWFQPPALFGEPGYQSFTVPATNPFNPFGQTVGISGLLSSLGREGSPYIDNFFRPLLGIRGDLGDRWHWEVAGWMTQDRSEQFITNFLNDTATQNALNSTNPATALNPFVDGPPGSPALLQPLVYELSQNFMTREVAVNGFIRGDIADLPSGAISVLLGAEYFSDRLFIDEVNYPGTPPNAESTYTHSSHAIFAETRVPLIGPQTATESNPRLAITAAGRYDDYSDFGSTFNPQLGIEGRPLEPLLLRANYSKAFVAPSLIDLHAPQILIPGSAVVDPLRNNQTEFVTVVDGGNPGLRPETGHSRTFGAVYANDQWFGLRLSVTNWEVTEEGNIQSLSLQSIVSNESSFPAYVTRASNCAGGQPCPITEVFSTFVNFGSINVAGFDYQAGMRFETTAGQFSPLVSATQVYRYNAVLIPGMPAVSGVSAAQDTNDWAPRWKGQLALGWKKGPATVSVTGRYVGPYQDYDSTAKIGNFWLADTNVRWSLPTGWFPKSSYVEVGGVNVFNRLPQFSNFDFGTVGYDAAQADLRGRYLYVRLNATW